MRSLADGEARKKRREETQRPRSLRWHGTALEAELGDLPNWIGDPLTGGGRHLSEHCITIVMSFCAVSLCQKCFTHRLAKTGVVDSNFV